MNDPLFEAIGQRRKAKLPSEEMASEKKGGIKDLLMSLDDEEKKELFEALKSELSSNEESDGLSESYEDDDETPKENMTDKSGRLKSTPGEIKALESEGIDPGVAKSLGADKYSGDETGTDLASRARINIAKLIKQKDK